jgi:hypothetical protein
MVVRNNSYNCCVDEVFQVTPFSRSLIGGEHGNGNGVGIVLHLHKPQTHQIFSISYTRTKNSIEGKIETKIIITQWMFL